MQDGSNPEVDFNRDGRYSILDAVALLIYIHQHGAGEFSAVLGSDKINQDSPHVSGSK
jgi:hypothetical protein